MYVTSRLIRRDEVMRVSPCVTWSSHYLRLLGATDGFKEFKLAQPSRVLEVEDEDEDDDDNDDDGDQKEEVHEKWESAPRPAQR